MSVKTKKAEENGVVNRVSSVLGNQIYNPEIMVFTVVGISPLLQNNPAPFIGKKEDDGLKARKKTYNDEEEASLRTYKNADGQFCHPTQGFIKSLLRAATGKKFNKVSAPGVIRGSVFAVESLCVIEDDSGKPAKKYAINREPVVVGDARVLRCRPEWHPWRMKVALEVNTAMISRENVEQTLALAGFTVGVGDFRPEKSGRFGRFKVE